MNRDHNPTLQSAIVIFTDPRRMGIDPEVQRAANILAHEWCIEHGYEEREEDRDE